MEYSYDLIRPKGNHKSFRVLRRTIVTRTYVTIKDAVIEAVNRQFKIGAIDHAEAEKQLRAFIDERERSEGLKRAPSVFQNENIELLQRYYDEEYSKRIVIDPKAEYNALMRAITALGTDISILSSSEAKIQVQVNNYCKDGRGKVDNNKQRRIVDKLKILLKYAGRKDVKLRPAKKDRQEIRHLTEQELSEVLLQIDDEKLKLAVQVGFYTGCRIGECFALNGDPSNRVLLVATQIDRTGNERETKNRNKREIVIDAKAVSLVQTWIDSERFNFPHSHSGTSKLFKKACEKAFPQRKNKWCSFHDLRHSYAITWLARGLTSDEIAAMIGDTPEVVREHYLGKTLTSSSINRILALSADLKDSGNDAKAS